MNNKTINLFEQRTDRQNAIFILKNSVNSVDYAIHNLVNPISKISEDARIYLRFSQRVAIENSFSLRTVHLKSLLSELKKQISQSDEKILSNLNIIRMKIEKLRNEYLRSEMVFGYYIDLLSTRGIHLGGKILKGYDVLSIETLKIFLHKLKYEIPMVVVYLEHIGDGAAIMRADISLWDRIRNPCAVIKLPQSSLNTPRSSIFHEAGHQIGSITGLNREAGQLLFNTIRGSGGSIELAKYWKSCASEIVADQIATQLTNWISAVTLFNIYAGSSGSGVGFSGRMFTIIPHDPHLMGYLRVKCNLESCKQAFGDGPWNQMDKVLNILYPTSLAFPYSRKIIRESLPILPNICRVLSRTKLSSFRGKSFEDMFSINTCSPRMIRKLLNFNLTNFSIDMNTKIQNPIQTLVGFGILQMLGGKSYYWINNEMAEWLSKLGEKELN